jgi:hypothetical protein
MFFAYIYSALLASVHIVLIVAGNEAQVIRIVPVDNFSSVSASGQSSTCPPYVFINRSSIYLTPQLAAAPYYVVMGAVAVAPSEQNALLMGFIATFPVGSLINFVVHNFANIATYL